MTELVTQDENVVYGKVQIADEVLAIIAGTAALETEGIAGMAGNISHSISEKLGMRDFSKGVKIAVEGNEVVAELNVLMNYNSKIHEVSAEVQRRVKNAIETMTGLETTTVNLNITGFVFEKEKKEPAKE